MSDDVTAAAEYIRLHPERTMGPWLVGGMIEVLLMGALVSMLSEYCERYGETDSWKIKAAVWANIFLNVLRTAQTVASLWHNLVVGFGDSIAAATSRPWYMRLDPLTTVITCLLVQCFLAARLHSLTGGLRWLLLLLIPTMSLALGGHIAVIVEEHVSGSIFSISRFKASMCAALGGLVASDFVITVSLTYFLWNSKTGIQRTDGLIWRVLHLTWITAALPCVSQLLDLVVYFSELGTGNSTFLIFHFLGPKLYSLSMMYTLNARQGLRRRDNSVPLSTVDGLPTARIKISREVLRFEDGDRPRGAPSVKSSDIDATEQFASRACRGFHETDTIKAPPVI